MSLFLSLNKHSTMKVFTITILFLTLSLVTFAQQGLDSTNHNLINQSKYVHLCADNTPDMASINGLYCEWDFSSVQGAGTMRKLSFTHPDSTAFASDFSAYTNYAMEVEGFITTYNMHGSNGLDEYGYVLPNTDLGDIKAKFFTNSWYKYSYPFQFDSSHVDGYTGNIAFVLNGNAQNPSCYGFGYADYDGFGKMIQANGDTLNNVARLKLLDTTYTSIPVFGQVRLIREQYQYYNMDSAGQMPVFIYAHAYVLSSLPNPLMNITIALSDVQPDLTVGLDEAKLTEEHPKVFPNPSSGSVHVTGLKVGSNYAVYSMDGKLVESGTGLQSIELQLENGIYLLQIEGNQQRFTEKIIVRK